MPQDSPTDAAAGPTLYSIGEVSSLTGLSTHMVRVWERRYGRPEAIRLPSGHRRYDEGHVLWLRTLAELLSFGHRPGRLMERTQAELDALLAEERGTDASERQGYQALIEAVREQGGKTLRQRLEEQVREDGVRATVHGFIAPLMQVVGQLWADGELAIRHEHVISEVLVDALRTLRAGAVEDEVPQRPGGPHLVLATLPDERHGLGLEMVHLLAALSGLEAEVLGVDLPVVEIAAIARRYPDAAVGISVSLNATGPAADRMLAELREALPDGQELLVGGQGARSGRRGPRGVRILDGLDAFENWVRERYPDQAAG